MKMYNVLVSISLFYVIFWLQSYDIFPNGVSVSYGKDAERPEQETPKNQRVNKNKALQPMEKCV